MHLISRFVILSNFLLGALLPAPPPDWRLQLPVGWGPVGGPRAVGLSLPGPVEPLRIPSPRSSLAVLVVQSGRPVSHFVEVLLLAPVWRGSVLRTGSGVPLPAPSPLIHPPLRRPGAPPLPWPGTGPPLVLGPAVGGEVAPIPVPIPPAGVLPLLLFPAAAGGPVPVRPRPLGPIGPPRPLGAVGGAAGGVAGTVGAGGERAGDGAARSRPLLGITAEAQPDSLLVKKI